MMETVGVVRAIRRIEAKPISDLLKTICLAHKKVSGLQQVKKNLFTVRTHTTPNRPVFSESENGLTLALWYLRRVEQSSSTSFCSVSVFAAVTIVIDMARYEFWHFISPFFYSQALTIVATG